MDSKDIVARFESEQQALALMNHPNIAQVYDSGTTEQGYPYFVMEYVPGIPITEYCDKNKMTTKERLNLFENVCDAIQHAHFKGIIHRDIKPSNVLVTFQDDKHIPKIIDFGIAKALTGQGLTEKTIHTIHGVAIGTPIYMSPEQAELTGYDIDTRSDVYSLGVLLYEVLVGVTPFEEKELEKAGLMEILRIIREEEPSKPSTRFNSLGDTSTDVAKKRSKSEVGMAKQLRGDLDWIVMKALEKDKKRRYNSAADLASDMERYLKQEPILARPPSFVYKTKKYLRRNKTKIIIPSSVILVLLLSSFSYFLFKKFTAYKDAVQLHEINIFPGYRILGDFYKDTIFEGEICVGPVNEEKLEIYSSDSAQRKIPDWLLLKKVGSCDVDSLLFAFSIDTSREGRMNETLIFRDNMRVSRSLDFSINIKQDDIKDNNVLFFKSYYSWLKVGGRFNRYHNFFRNLNVKVNCLNYWKDDLDKYSLVIIDRDGFIELTDENISSLQDYIRRGGNLLILHYTNIYKGKQKYNKLFAPFGMQSIQIKDFSEKGIINKNFIEDHEITKDVVSVNFNFWSGVNITNNNARIIISDSKNEKEGIIVVYENEGKLIVIPSSLENLIIPINQKLFENILMLKRKNSSSGE